MYRCAGCGYRPPEFLPRGHCPKCGGAWAEIETIWQLEPVDDAALAAPPTPTPAPLPSLRSPAPSVGVSGIDWSRVEHDERRHRHIQRLLNALLLPALVIFVLAWQQRQRLPRPAAIRSELARAPLQSPTDRAPFHFSYRGNSYEVRPMAEYQLWGLIVTHNDIQGITDTAHDADSVDTRDICVLWGSNLAASDYLKASYSSGNWTCHVEYPAGTRIEFTELSNNHLITADDEIRQQINHLQVGDQVYLKGALVGYRDPRLQGESWRNSSLVRTDQGNGACEVVYVEELQVLRASNPAWRTAFNVSRGLIVALLLTKALLFLRVSLRAHASTKDPVRGQRHLSSP